MGLVLCKFFHFKKIKLTIVISQIITIKGILMCVAILKGIKNGSRENKKALTRAP
jgi:hypothetical protein